MLAGGCPGGAPPPPPTERQSEAAASTAGIAGIAIRLVVKTEPSVQWKVERELRLRIKEAFDEAGIEIPFPQRTLWLRDQGSHQLAEAPDPATIKTVEPPRHQTVVSDADGD